MAHAVHTSSALNYKASVHCRWKNPTPATEMTCSCSQSSEGYEYRKHLYDESSQRQSVVCFRAIKHNQSDNRTPLLTAVFCWRELCNGRTLGERTVLPLNNIKYRKLFCFGSLIFFPPFPCWGLIIKGQFISLVKKLYVPWLWKYFYSFFVPGDQVRAIACSKVRLKSSMAGTILFIPLHLCSMEQQSIAHVEQIGDRLVHEWTQGVNRYVLGFAWCTQRLEILRIRQPKRFWSAPPPSTHIHPHLVSHAHTNVKACGETPNLFKMIRSRIFQRCLWFKMCYFSRSPIVSQHLFFK